jgi:N-acetyl sugar amidotransferase
MTEAWFGSPEEVKFCKKCVISNQRPSSCNEYFHTRESKHETIELDEDGICYACRVNEAKDKDIDWKDREEQLIQLLDEHRSKDGSYDVLVPGSGGKDSTFQAHVLKHKYGMHPLTITWTPHLYTNVGWRNFQRWLHKGGFDNYLFTPNPIVHRLMTKLAFENLLHPFQPFILGQKTFPLKMAKMLNIPLVMYGEMPGEYGAKVSINEKKFSTGKDGHSIDYLHGKDPDDLYMGGVQVRELKSKYGLKEGDLEAYMPMKLEDIQEKDIEFHYLGYYLRWTPQECYYYSVENIGFEANPERTEGTYSKYNSIDDKIDGYHYYTTFIKFGIGRATYDAAQEIRNHHLTREDGIALVKKYDGELPRKYFEEILEYMSLTEKQFHEICDKFRSPHLWDKKDGKWNLKHKIWEK